MTTYDRLIFGMKCLNVSQIGSGYDGKNHYSHVSYEVDLAGMDTGVDVWRNKMPNTLWYCAGAWGNASTGNTRFFWSYGTDKKPKKVLCADGALRYITLALTHSNKSYIVGKYYSHDEIMYQEGTSGYATGNHIHLEVCAGHTRTKVQNSKSGYNLANMLQANKCLFLLNGYSYTTNGGGLAWKTTNTVPYTVQESSDEAVDQILHIGSHVTFPSRMKVTKINKAKNWAYVSDLGGFISAKPLDEVDASDGKKDQILHANSVVTIKGVFKVTAVNKTTNCVKLKAYSGTTGNWVFDFWIKAKPLTEVV